ncbi:MAG: polysaccharide deacetylase family protein [Solirubrobacteraceae bacterium]
MSPRWNWDFDDHQRRTRTSAPPPGDRPRRPRSRRTIATRRAGALALVALVALIAATLSGSHARSRAPSAVVRAGTRREPTATAKADAGANAGADAWPGTPAASQQAVSAVLAYTPFVKEGGGRAREIALTFDDGPGPYTPGVLDVLERYRVHATFFEIGEMLRYFGASTVRELRDGDVIGDHTETHPEMARLSAHDQHEELFEQLARIELLGGPRPLLFRPPYGSYDATTMHELHELHLLMVLWSVDTEDYLQPGVPVIVQRALAGAHPGAIILMHDAGGTRTQTIAALPLIIRALRARGFKLVTVPQLLHDDPPPPGQALPSSLEGD